MNRIRELRQTKNLKQVDLAKILKVAQGTLSGWETGTFEPNIESIKFLSQYFNVSIDYLLGNDTKREPPTISDGGPSSEIARLVNQLTEEQQKYLLAQIKGLLSEQE